MKKNDQTTLEHCLKVYIRPELEVIFVEMECGIAANSAAVIPSTVETEIKTDWEGEDDTTIIAPF